MTDQIEGQTTGLLGNKSSSLGSNVMFQQLPFRTCFSKHYQDLDQLGFCIWKQMQETQDFPCE